MYICMRHLASQFPTHQPAIFFSFCSLALTGLAQHDSEFTDTISTQCYMSLLKSRTIEMLSLLLALITLEDAIKNSLHFLEQEAAFNIGLNEHIVHKDMWEKTHFLKWKLPIVHTDRNHSNWQSTQL